MLGKILKKHDTYKELYIDVVVVVAAPVQCSTDASVGRWWRWPGALGHIEKRCRLVTVRVEGQTA